MAWLVAKKSGIFHIGFRFGGEEFTRSLRTKSEKSAVANLHRLEETIQLIERGRLNVPPDADLCTFILSDGKYGQPQHTTKRVKLGELFEAYKSSLPQNSLAPESLRIAQIHMRHVCRILGKKRDVRTVHAEQLQLFISKRSKEKGKRGKSVAAGTIRKELATFRTLYRWARRSGYVERAFPNEHLKFPVQQEKPPFQTWQQIERQVANSSLTQHQIADLWASLYLNTVQLEELLAFIAEHSTYAFLYPMAVFAAHTGARRSELCRSNVSDFDFEEGMIRIREKKRQKGRLTSRHVPMSSTLRGVMQSWFAKNPGTPFAFPAEHRVERKRNSNRRDECGSVSPDEATDHLQQTLSRSDYDRIAGWHIFRHSFISNLCSTGVDQRFIDAFVGHQTDAMRERYRHLFPNTMKEALATTFR